MSYVNILKAGTDHSLWIKGLEFYNDELDLMEKRLLEISGKNTSMDAVKGVEHFQNQFMIQQKNISDMKHEVKKYVNDISHDAKHHGGHIDAAYLDQSKNLSERYEQQEQIMNSLRHEFNEFLSKWM